RAGAVGLPPGLTLGAIDRDARFADRARVAAELRGTQLANEGTALANRGAALTQQQTEQQAALMQDLLSGDEARRNTAAEKLARLNALAAKPEAPITASVAGEHGADQYVVDPRTGRTIFGPAKARAVAQSRNAISAALADGDERLAQELADQLARAHGIRIDIGAAAE
ncbi:MAG: hypothetical protein KDI48_17100, partial [Xanthomonadales bacterium]|nr:hypothetical protein [Xanthomonadales bacterium]